MTKLIGYARVSTRQQSTDRQQTDLVAAGVRRDDLYVDHGAMSPFSEVPAKIADLPYWQQEVAPWWDKYTSLLARIPMRVPVDVATTEPVVDEIARLLQCWAKGIGVDYRDTPQGPWFQMARSV